MNMEKLNKKMHLFSKKVHFMPERHFLKRKCFKNERMKAKERLAQRIGRSTRRVEIKQIFSKSFKYIFRQDNPYIIL